MEVHEEKSFQSGAEKSLIWAVLNDPWKVASCLPGAQIVEKVTDRQYKGKIKVKIGPVTTDFDGEVEFTKLDADNHEFHLEGQGIDKNGKGSASMTMEIVLIDQEDGQTTVKCDVSISITGRIAQFGGRMIKAVNHKMFQEFTKNFLNLLEKHETQGENVEIGEAGTLNAGSMVASMVGDSIKGVFRKKKDKE